MARQARSSQLENRTQRLKLIPRWKPYTARVGPGVRLGYRRKALAGRWSVIAADGKGGNWLKAFADADDYESSNGTSILDYWQAQDMARRLARTGKGNEVASDAPITVATALENYEADLEIRGGDAGNASRVRGHLSDTLLRKAVALLTAKELKRWRDGLTKTLSDGTVNRIANALRAAFNLAANTDERILDRRAWEIGLEAIPDAVESRNVILPAQSIQRIVAECYSTSEEFGLLIEVAATTGARIGQIAQLEPADVQHSRTDPRLLMPTAKKGKGKKRITRRPVPIPESLAVRLRQVANRRAKGSRLLLKPSGEPWGKSDHSRLFRRAVKRAGLDPKEVTVYALRHSNIVRQILHGTPIRIVATNHDTSVAMVEKTYSKNIGDHSDAVARPALLDLSELPAAANVVPLGAQVTKRKPKAPAPIDAVSVLDPHTGGLAESYKRTVAAALPQDVSPTEEFWRDLETAVVAYLSLAGRHASRSLKQDLQDWKDIDAMASILGEKLRAVRRQTPRDTFEPLLVLPALLALKRRAEACVLAYETIGASFRGTKNPHRAYLYGAVFDLWRCPRDAVRIHLLDDGDFWDPPTGLGQKLAYSRREGEPHGPLIRFFIAIVGPVLGDAAPNAYGIATIIKRERAAIIERERKRSPYFFGPEK